MNKAAVDQAAAYDAAVRQARMNGTAVNESGLHESSIGIGAAAGAQAADRPRARPGQLRLAITAGVHEGAVLVLDPGEYRIGSSPDADIVLSDAGVAAEHAAVHVDFDGVHLDAIGADLTVGQDPLPQSRGCRVRLPATFSVGTATIELLDPTEGRTERPSARPLRSPALVAAAIACVGVVIAGTAITMRELARRSGTGAGPSDTQTAQAQPPAAPSSATVQPTPPQRVVPPVPTVEEAMAALKTRLDAADIKSLEVVAEGGRLVARGTLTGHETTDWPPVQQWFDKTYGRNVVLSARIMAGVPPNLPALQIQAVWWGERPYVMLSDGEHYFKGAVLDNGWVIRDILPDRLVLAKDSDTVTLTYH